MWMLVGCNPFLGGLTCALFALRLLLICFLGQLHLFLICSPLAFHLLVICFLALFRLLFRGTEASPLRALGAHSASDSLLTRRFNSSSLTYSAKSSFAFHLPATCFSLARYLLSACLEGKAHRPQTRPGGRPLPAVYPPHRRPYIYAMRTVYSTHRLPTPARGAMRAKRQAQSATKNETDRREQWRRLRARRGEPPTRHDRPRRDGVLSRHDSWRSVPMTSRPPAASTFSCSSARLPLDAAGSSSARLPFDVAGSSSTPLPLNEEGFWFGTVGLCHPDELASVFWTTFQLSRALRRGTIPKSNG